MLAISLGRYAHPVSYVTTKMVVSVNSKSRIDAFNLQPR